MSIIHGTSLVREKAKSDLKKLCNKESRCSLLTLYSQLQILEVNINLFEIYETMMKFFGAVWRFDLLRSLAIDELKRQAYEYKIGMKTLKKWERRLMDCRNNWEIFEFMTGHEWDFTFQELLERAEHDLSNYIDEYESENNEVAYEYPVWVADLKQCKTSPEIMEYMQEFGWSDKCMCKKYLHLKCKHCERLFKELNDD